MPGRPPSHQTQDARLSLSRPSGPLRPGDTERCEQLPLPEPVHRLWT